MPFLFDSIIVGPIRSRRLGKSLGVNLLPPNGKLCNFDCIYCECGWNADGKGKGEALKYVDTDAVIQGLEKRLKELQQSNDLPDAITFAGNGEPTMHPDFAKIVDAVIELRNKYAPSAKVSVLTNAALSGRPEVLNALRKVDKPMLKLDAGTNETFQLINNPQENLTLEQVVNNMSQFGKNLMVQSMFLQGTYNGKPIDNSSPDELEPWLKIIEQLHPGEVMLYSIDRATPAKGLEKVSPEKLEEIANRVRVLGITANVFS
jgi:wyosine [tRNA(Phe)-imidazoG37] synthetase (radical SAM superfamily)